MKFTPIYRCRLCGMTYKTTPTDNAEDAEQVMQDHTHGMVCTILGAPRILETHACTGTHAGSMGLADFLGLEAEGDA